LPHAFRFVPVLGYSDYERKKERKKYGYQNNSEFYADLESVEKNAKNLLTKKLWAKEVCKIGVWPLPYY
jgi:hypothetical protein